MGIAQGIVLNTGIALISEVIGSQGSGGAFVFGCYGFVDRLSSGICIYIIMNNPNFPNI